MTENIWRLPMDLDACDQLCRKAGLWEDWEACSYEALGDVVGRACARLGLDIADARVMSNRQLFRTSLGTGRQADEARAEMVWRAGLLDKWESTPIEGRAELLIQARRELL